MCDLDDDEVESAGCALLLGVALLAAGIGTLFGAGYGMLAAGGVLILFVVVVGARKRRAQ